MNSAKQKKIAAKAKMNWNDAKQKAKQTRIEPREHQGMK
jgi:hypothetical protein